MSSHALHTKTAHPFEIGPLDLDCDILTDPGGDPHIVILTAAPGSDTAGRLDLLGAIGTEQMTEPHNGTNRVIGNGPTSHP
ncbi:hypothetical protein ACWEQO_12355 [Streptomyces sp. NPDC004051]